MCGIFGFISTAGRQPDLARLRRIAAVTESRGRHAFGLAWLDADRRIATFKRPGAASDDLGDLARAGNATILIGHCRYATHGDPEDNRNNHPHPAGRGWLVHNGVVQNYLGLIHRYGLRPKSSCDSEVLGLLIQRFAGSIARRAARAASVASGRLTILGLWSDPGRLLVVRHGNPLSVGRAKEGLYFGSLPAGLPGRVREIKDASVGVIASGAQGLVQSRLSIDALVPSLF